MLISLTAEEVIWLIERVANDDFGGDEDGYEVDPYNLITSLAKSYVEIIPKIFADEEIEGEYSVPVTLAELWVLREKVSNFDTTPEGEKLGMKLLLKIYSAILKAGDDDAFLASLSHAMGSEGHSPRKSGDDKEYAVV